MSNDRQHSRASRLLAAAALFIGGALTAGIASAGTVILEGSDAIGLHSTFGDAGAIAYRDQAFSAIGGADLRPIAIIGVGTGTPITSGTHAVVNFASVAAAGTLSDYVALYFVATGGCCSADDSLVTAAGAAAAVGAYLTGGGTIMIQDYTGGAAWDFAVGTVGGGNAHVIGVDGGAGPGTICDDGETVTADGLANGFTQPPVIGCWSHQGYEQSFFAPLGFTLSFFDAAPGMGGAGWSSLLSSGRTVSFTPEPGSIALVSLALFGLVTLRTRPRS